MKYAFELLQASGFIASDDRESIVYQERSIEPLQLAQDTLMNGQPIQVQLDRNLKIFQPTKERASIPPVQLLPQDPLFYQTTVGEVLREKQRQKDLVDKEEMLRTKAMRERDEKSEVNIQYKYTVIRIRMPNEIILQVIFQSNDPISLLVATLFDQKLAMFASNFQQFNIDHLQYHFTPPNTQLYPTPAPMPFDPVAFLAKQQQHRLA